MNARADALARLFEAVHEGVLLGTLDSQGDTTEAANAHLKGMLGFPSGRNPNATVFIAPGCGTNG